MENEQSNLNDKLHPENAESQPGGSPGGETQGGTKKTPESEDLAMPEIGLNRERQKASGGQSGESEFPGEAGQGGLAVSPETKANPQNWHENDAEAEMMRMMEGGQGATVDFHGHDHGAAGSEPTRKIVEKVNFDPLQPGARTEPKNLNMLLDVSLPISIELGRTAMAIEDILNLGPGSVVELDKLAGEPVDLLVNNKLMAKGEVVVIDENFGVRITNMVSPGDRIRSLQ